MRFCLEYRGQQIELQAGETIVGRDSSCYVRLLDESASRRHLRICVDARGGSLTAEDLLSTNGTRLNDKPVLGRVRLTDGDVLRCGCGVLTVRVLREGTPPLEQPAPPSPGLLLQATVATCSRCWTALAETDPCCPTCGLAVATAPWVLRTRDSQNRRQEQRVTANVAVHYASESARFAGVAHDLSLGGVFIAGAREEYVASECRLTFVPEAGLTLPAVGIVRHVIPAETRQGHPPGIGIKFKVIERETWQWLHELIQCERASATATATA